MFTHPPIGNTERNINIQVFIDRTTTKPAEDVLSKYMLSGFNDIWQKNFDFLIDCICEKKLKIESPQINWKMLSVIEGIGIITNRHTKQSFKIEKPQFIKDVIRDIKYPFQRCTDILRIKSEINYDWQPPIYIHSQIIDQSLDPNHIYMLDGARRMVASCLNHLEKIKVWILFPKK